MRRWAPWLVFLVTLAVGLVPYWLLGPLNGPRDLDEAVYYQAARAWLTGHAPYTDFVYTQPPLSLVLLMPAVLVDFATGSQSAGFALGRIVSTFCLAATAGLIWLIFDRRFRSPFGGALAVLLLLIDSTTLVVSHRILLEPILNLLAVLVLLLALEECWLLAGIVAALAMLTKSQGVLALIPLIAVGCARRQWLSLATGCALAGFVSAVSLGVGSLLTSGELLQQVFLFQMVRPAEVTLAQLGGMPYLLFGPERLLTLVAVPGLLRVTRAWQVDKGAAAGIVGLAVGALLLIGRSYGYYYHYWVQLALPIAMIGGFFMIGAATARVSLARRLALSALAVIGLIQPVRLGQFASNDGEVSAIRSRASEAVGTGFDPVGWANIILNESSPTANGKLAVDGLATSQYLSIRPFSIAHEWTDMNWDSLSTDLIGASDWMWTDPQGDRLLHQEQHRLMDTKFGDQVIEADYRFYAGP